MYHDQTPYFLERLEATVGEKILVRLRLFAPVKKVFLLMLRYGEMFKVEMRLSKQISVGTSTQIDFEAELELFSATMRYLFWCETENDTQLVAEIGVGRTMPSLRNWFQFVADQHRPAWLNDRVFYQIFPDRFKNGDPNNTAQAGEWNYMGKPIITKSWQELPDAKTGPLEHFGGDLIGIEQSLDYLEDLGVNGLYLTPIFDSPSNHRYDTRDYMQVDKHLGGEMALRSLLDASKKRGMRFILDAVFNHTGDEFQPFKNALAGGPEQELFNIYPDKTYASFFGVPTMPKINYESERSYQEFFEHDSAPLRHWLRFGTDGWRLDVAHMMGANGTDEKNLEIHRRLKNAARKENPEAWIFGERFLDAEPYLQGANAALGVGAAGEDGVMNYQGFALPITDWLSGQTIFGTPTQLDGSEASQKILEVWRALPPLARASHYNLLGSHDVPRLLERLGGNAKLQAVAFAILLSFPGVPGIYYGDEIGMMGGADPMNRAPFPWDKNNWNTNLHQTVRALISARKQSQELQSGALVWLHASNHTLAFARPFTQHNGETRAAILLASRKTGPETVRLDLKQAGLLAGSWKDAISGQRFQAVNAELNLDFENFRVLIPE